MIKLALIKHRIHTLSSVLPLLSALLSASLLGGCDGGLFGTGDGDELQLTDSPAEAAEQPIPPSTLPPAENAPESGINPDSDLQSPPVALAFSNTESAGLSTSSPELPALKVINLLDTSVSATLAGTTSVTANPQSSSSLLVVNVGESQVFFSAGEPASQLATINPLNATADSITTVLLSDGQGGTDSEQLNFFAVSTRAVVSAPGMAQVRLILARAPEDAEPQSPFTLQSDDSLSAGADLVFTDFFNNNRPLANYSLANPGRYQLMAADESFPAQTIELLPDQVYTLIITGNEQMPVFIEVDNLIE